MKCLQMLESINRKKTRNMKTRNNKLIKLSIAGALICTAAFLESCNYAKSNQQVVISTDCGMTWEEIKAGDAVPKAGLNACYMKVVIPNYPMQGETKFISNLKDRVRA